MTVHGSIRLRDLAARFLAGYVPPGCRNLDSYRSHVRSCCHVWILPHVGARWAHQVRAPHVEELRDAIVAVRSPALAVSVLGVLSRLYRWGLARGLVAGTNPCDGVARPPTPHSTDYYDRDEIRRLLAGARSAPPLLRAQVVVALYTGLRKGELYGLRWSDVEIESRRLTVRRSYDHATTKGGRSRHLPLHPAAASALRSWRRFCPPLDDLVFPQRTGVGELRMGRSSDGIEIRALLAQARCRRYPHPWHALRHTFASHLVMGGGSLAAVQALLGHASPATTSRYAHLSPDYLTAEMARLRF